MEEETNRKIEDVVESVQEHMESLLKICSKPNENDLTELFGSDLEEKVGQLEINIKYYQETIGSLKEENLWLKEETDKIRTELEKTREEHESAKKEANFLKKELENTQSMANYKTAKLEEISLKTIEELKTIYETENSKLRMKLKEKNKKTEPELSKVSVEEISSEIKESLIEIAKKLKVYVDSITDTRDSNEIKQGLEQFDKFQNDISKVIKTLSNFHAVFQKLENSNTKLKDKLKEKDEELDKLKANLSLKASHSENLLGKHTDILLEKEQEIDDLKKAIVKLRLEYDEQSSQPQNSSKHFRRHSSHHVPNSKQFEEIKRENTQFSIELGKMKTARDKAKLDYDVILQELKNTKFKLASAQEKSAQQQFEDRMYIRDLIYVLKKLDEEKNVSRKSKELLNSVLKHKFCFHRSSRSCEASPDRNIKF